MLKVFRSLNQCEIFLCEVFASIFCYIFLRYSDRPSIAAIAAVLPKIKMMALEAKMADKLTESMKPCTYRPRLGPRPNR
jgi:hypothetical protein